ncbi:MAG TPA: hypothetical protein VMD08_09575 [Candidatus Baltobacteraceae bacterium]|nr:hypothetical protein [Candidatus Baltobacteraceae bacterium]
MHSRDMKTSDPIRLAARAFLAGVLLCASLLPQIASAAADPSAELQTAITHVAFAMKYEGIKEITLHMHHTVNCLVGPQDKLFDTAAGNPCQGMGNGYLADHKASAGQNNQYYEAWWAVQIAAQAFASNDVPTVKAAARIVNLILENISKSK